jgi:hypothetical protein
MGNDNTEKASAYQSFCNFKWLHVRRVRVALVGDAYAMTCDCGQIERCCIACRHALCVMLEVCGTFNLDVQLFNRRMLLNYYYQCLCTETATSPTDNDMLLRIPKNSMELYVSSHLHPTRDGVPEPGAWALPRDLDTGDCHEVGGIKEQGSRRNRVVKPSKRIATSLHTAYLEDIADVDLSEYCAYLNACIAAKGRRSVPTKLGSHGVLNRSCGVADAGRLPKHAKKDASKGKSSRSESKKKTIETADAPIIQHTNAMLEDARIQTLQQKIIQCGVNTGFFVEMFPPKGSKSDRWFMQVLNGRTVGPSKDPYLQNAIWCKANTIEVQKPPLLGKCNIRSIKDSGPADHFKNIFAKKTTSNTGKISNPVAVPLPQYAPAPTLAPAPGIASIAWQEVVVGWKNTQGRLVANSETWILQRKANEVHSVPYLELRSAMQKTHVPGVVYAKNKDDLIRIMCKFNCVYSTATLPMISLGSQYSTASSTTAAACAPSAPEVLDFVRQMRSSESSSSDSDAPSSKGDAATRTVTETAKQQASKKIIISSDSDEDAPLALKVSRQAEQRAQQQETMERHKKISEQHVERQKEIQKQKAAQTAKAPKFITKRPAASSKCCTCGIAELRSEKCSYCSQFEL